MYLNFSPKRLLEKELIGINDMVDKSDLIDECTNVIHLGNSLISKIDELDHQEIEGLDKLKSSINKDLNFLSKTLKKGVLKKDHVAGSIINQYDFLLSYLLNSNNCTAVLKAFRFKSETPEQQEKKIYVDVVSEGKKKWTKVVRKNPKALSIIFLGEGDFGRKSIVDQAYDFLACAKQNLRFFKAPMVEFYFACGIESSLAKTLTEMGINVTGKVLYEINSKKLKHLNHSNKPFQQLHLSTIKEGCVTKLNLDLNTMISYVSGLTNGETDCKLNGRIMNEQAKEERDCPLKPTLDLLFQGKQLYSCRSAVDGFKCILEIQGGPGEKRRGMELLERLSIVDDAPLEFLTNRDCGLKVEPGMKGRTLAVFATGVMLGAATVTASMGFVTAAKDQGCSLDVIIHEPRALSEIKVLQQ